MNSCQYPNQVEKWDVFEIRLKGFSEGNPFTDYDIMATFSSIHEKKTVRGFYDGDGLQPCRGAIAIDSAVAHRQRAPIPHGDQRPYSIE